MSTTYPINFPNSAPAIEKLSLARRQGVSQSPWTYAQQTISTAAQWRLEFTWPRMTFAQAEFCAAWIDSLNGQSGTFWYQPRQPFLSTLAGQTVFTKAFATNSAVSVAGWSANENPRLRVGQFFQIGSQLLRITSAPAQADVNGRCTINFEPSLRRDFDAGTTLNFIAPRGLFRLASSDGIAFTLDPDAAPEFPTISAVEAVEG